MKRKMSASSAAPTLMGVVAAVLLPLQIACGPAHSSAPAPTAPQVATTTTATTSATNPPMIPFASNDLVIQEARKRLLSTVPAEGKLAVFLQLSAGDVAANAKRDLLAQLNNDPRIVWSVGSSQPGEPVADSSRPGEHVNTVIYRFDPPPNLVVAVSDRDGHLYIAARPAGADPLGPETAWTWILVGP